MNLRPYHKFQHRGNTYLLNVERLLAFRVDEATAECLASISANPILPSTPEIQERLAALDLISPEGKEPGSRRPEPPPLENIALFVTQKCNLRCVYCYGGDGSYGSEGEMGQTTARRAVDWLLEQSKQVKKLGIGIFGGEPLMNFPVVKDVVLYAEKRGAETGKVVHFEVATNASLLDKGKIAFFKEHDIDVQVSLDGPKQVQDAQRPFRGGKGSYEATVPRIKELLEALPESGCRAILVAPTDPQQVKDALHGIGFLSTSITPASRSLHAKGDNFERSMSGLVAMFESEIEDLLENIKSQDAQKLERDWLSGSWSVTIPDFLNEQIRDFPCGAGRKFVGVSTSGDVFLCHRFVGMDEYRLGTIFNGNLNRGDYQESPLTFVEKCSRCFARYLCGGGCMHDHLGITGSIFEPAEDICQMVQRMTELVSYVAAELTEEDRTYLTKQELLPKKPCPLDFGSS